MDVKAAMWSRRSWSACTSGVRRVPESTAVRRVPVSVAEPYDVLVGTDLLRRLPELVPNPQVALICDENVRSEEHTSELQSRGHLVCRLLLEKKKRCRDQA